MEWGAGGYQNLQVRTTRQQVGDACRGGQEMLEVVEHEEERAAVQRFLQGFDQGLTDSLLDAARLGDGRDDQTRIGDGRERDENNPTGKLLDEVSRDLEAEAGLPNSARARQGDQANVGPSQRVLGPSGLLVAADQACQDSRQIGERPDEVRALPKSRKIRGRWTGAACGKLQPDALGGSELESIGQEVYRRPA